MRPTAEFGPVHPALRAVASVFGARSILAHQVVLAVVGSLTPVLTAILAARLTGDRRIALGSGVLAALHPMLFGSDGAVMSETTYTLLAVLPGITSLLIAKPDVPWPDRDQLIDHVLATLVRGLAVQPEMSRTNES